MNETELEAILLTHGWEDTGGGNNFTSYRSKTGLVVYVFGSVAGSGPYDGHWIQVDPTDDDVFLSGGFSAESLKRFLKM